MKALPGAELACRAHNLPQSHPAQPRGIISYYATLALTEVATVGDWLARIETLTQEDATAIALEHTALWQLHRSTLQPLFSAQPDLLLHVMANMADRIAHLAELVADLSLHTVEVRLARLLLEAGADGTLERQAWLTQAELAARLGTVLGCAAGPGRRVEPGGTPFGTQVGIGRVGRQQLLP